MQCADISAYTVTTMNNPKELRFGCTTGSCAAAAAKAAVFMLLTGRIKNSVSLMTPKGIELKLDIEKISLCENGVSCAVKKYSGDDPDITDGAYIFARAAKCGDGGIKITGGKGIGRVTKPGLDRPVGDAAINSVPRKMIEQNVSSLCGALDYNGGIEIEISVPNGEELAKKTFNPRLGIVGGISILGTTGIVEPMSEQALIDTIRVELRQKRECGVKTVLLTPGNYGSEYIKSSIGISPQTAVLTSNFIGEALDSCRELGFDGALLIGHIGKLVKLAGGMLNTHSRYGDCRMEIIAAHAAAAGLGRDDINSVLSCVSCDDAVRILKENALCDETMRRICDKIAFIMDSRVMGELKTGAVFFSNKYGELGRTENADRLLAIIKNGNE